MNEYSSNERASAQILASAHAIHSSRRAGALALAGVALSVLSLGFTQSAMAQGAGEVVPLDTIDVQGSTERANGPVQGYVARRSATAMKTDTPLIETPQSITVVTRDQMNDQAAQSVGQALRYSAGVLAETRLSSGRYDSAFIRGFGGSGGNAGFISIPNEDVAVKLIRDPAFSKAFVNAGAGKGLIGLTLNYTGPIVFAMRAPMRALADFKGKKIRVLASPFQTEQTSKLGATGVAMSLADVLPAIQQGTIDGAMSSAGVFTALQYFDAAKYMTESEHAYVFSIAVVSKRWFETLPDDLKEIVVKTAKDASDDVLPWSLNFVAEQRKLWTARGGEFIRLSPEDYAQVMKTMGPIGDEVVKTRSDTKQLWDLMNATIKRVQ